MAQVTAVDNSTPSITELIARLQDAWPNLTTEQIYSRMDLNRQELARVQDAGATPRAVQSTDLPDFQYGIGAEEGQGDDSVSSKDVFGEREFHGVFGAENAQDEQIEKWLSSKSKRLFHYKAEKFDGTGFLTWKKCILRLLGMVKLSELVLTDNPFDDTSSIDFKKWVEADILVINFLNTQVTQKYCIYMNSCSSAHSMWEMLLDRFENDALENWSSIFSKWNAHSQGVTQLVDDYISEECVFYEQLLALGHDFGAEHRRSRLLMGLNSQFQPEARVYRRDSTTSFHKICNDLRIVELSYVRSVSVPPRNNFIEGNGSSRDRAPRDKTWSEKCTTCGKPGHVWKRCPHATKGADGRYVRICHNCLLPGHFKAQCPQAKNGPHTGQKDYILDTPSA